MVKNLHKLLWNKGMIWWLVWWLLDKEVEDSSPIATVFFYLKTSTFGEDLVALRKKNCQEKKLSHVARGMNLLKLG